MTSKEFVLNTLERYGRVAAQELQENADSMTGTELYADYMFIPSYAAAVEKCNMLERKAGFVCMSPGGRVVSLIQPYDSTVYTQDPEELIAQWRFKWSQNPEHARPFVAISTSPYGKGDVCSENGVVYRSTLDGNVWAPSAYAQGWEVVE